MSVNHHHQTTEFKMAAGHVLASSSNNLNFVAKCLDTNTIKSLNDTAHLIYEGNRVKWTQDFDSLKYFIENIAGLDGRWTLPGGKSKQFISANADLSMTWYPGKLNSLIFHGKDGILFKDFLVKTLEEPDIDSPILNAKFSTQTADSSVEPSLQLCEVVADTSATVEPELYIPSYHACDCNPYGLYTDGCSVDATSKNDVSIKLDQCTQTETQAAGCFSITLENQLLNVIEDMKLDIEILQTQTAALQTFVNSSEASAVGFDIIQEVTRLKGDLSNEGEKSKRLELELCNMKNKLLELCSYRQNTDVTNDFKDNSSFNDPNQVHLQKVIPIEVDPDTTLEHDCLNVTNESNVAHNSKTESFSHDLTHICKHKVNPTWVNTNEISEPSCINGKNEGLLTNDQAVTVSSLPKNADPDSYCPNYLAHSLPKTKPNVSNNTARLWMNNLPFVTIPKSNKQSCRKMDTIHGALNKSLPVPQLQLIKQSIKSKSTDVTSPSQQRVTSKTLETITDVEADLSKYPQTKDKISATLKHPTESIPKPDREVQRKSSLAKRIYLPLIGISEPLKKTINNNPDTKNTTYNTKIGPSNHTTPNDLSSFILLDGDECQMKKIAAKVIQPTNNRHHPFRYHPKNRPPRRKPRQLKYPGDHWHSYLDLVSRITRE